jgi:signal peptidase I
MMSDSGKDKAEPIALPSGRRPPVWLRLALDHLWVVGVPLLLALFLLVVHFTNDMDLTEVPPHPRVVQLVIALLGLSVIFGIPYLLYRKIIDETRDDLMLHRDAALSLKDAQRRFRKYESKLKPEARTAVSEVLTSVEKAMESEDNDELIRTLHALDQVISRHLAFARKSPLQEYGESIGGAIVIALLLRAFTVEAFKIPSGSMIPTLQVGDHIFVNKLLFGLRIPFTNIKFGHHLREPRRGEVIVFVYPHDMQKDFIKRIAAIPGDTIEVCNEQISINGQPISREPASGVCEYDDFDEERPGARWTHQLCRGFREKNGAETYRVVQDVMPNLHPCQKWVVPPEHVFVMGDNRDHSHDSRFWCEQRGLDGAMQCGPSDKVSFVPYELIKGKAWFIWWSAGKGSSVRLNRLFTSIH